MESLSLILHYEYFIKCLHYLDSGLYLLQQFLKVRISLPVARLGKVVGLIFVELEINNASSLK